MESLLGKEKKSLCWEWFVEKKDFKMGVKERVSYRWWEWRCNRVSRSDGNRRRKLWGGVRLTDWRRGSWLQRQGEAHRMCAWRVYVCVMYCRVWVRNITGTTALVRYVDYGNEDNVPRDALRQLPVAFWDNRPLAVPCHAASFSPDSPGESNHTCVISSILGDDWSKIYVSRHSFWCRVRQITSWVLSGGM